jgi:hypothetical protein
MKRLAFALAFCALLAGCNHLPPLLSEDSSGFREVVALIAYAQKVAGLQGEEQKKELNAANQSFSRDRSPSSRVRLALLLSLPGTPFTDEVRAMNLLEPLLAGGGDAAKGLPLRQFAGLIHAQVGERVREQRKSAQLREQSVQLKEQLDALRAIERSIIERGKPK